VGFGKNISNKDPTTNHNFDVIVCWDFPEASSKINQAGTTKKIQGLYG